MKSIAFVFIIFSAHGISQAQLPCQDAWSGSHANRSVEFSLVSQKNQTGHWVTKFSVGKASQRLPKNWKVDIKHSITSNGGMENFHLQGKLIVPPTLPEDYQLFPGVGFYKYHLKDVAVFDDAYATCAREGGHLAIINSEAEHDVIRSFVKQSSAYLGFHDRVKEGEFVTIFGKPLSSTGFTRWLVNQPDNAGGKEHCGTYYFHGGLNDVPCDEKIPFICEYDLSWAD